jgi:crotonobetainyl-CoA:carnitine CoA-transferase CaiB-like acyl-CoA transferase
MPQPLSGLLVLDFTTLLPGPLATLMLAEAGAEVIKVERPGGEDMRAMPPLHDGEAAVFALLNRGKKSVVLDLKNPSDRSRLRPLLESADVLVEQFRPGVMERLDLGFEAVAKVNPRLVYCSISGYGQDGPYRNRVGHDVNYLGFAGVIGLTGTAGGPPVIPGVQIADIGGGALMAAVGILAALAAREGTGRGQFVDIAMFDGAVAWQVVHVMRYLVDGREPARGDTMLTGHHPCYAIYETRDGRHVTVGALEPHFWRTLCERLGFPEYVETQFAEGEKRDEMFRRVRARFRERTMAEWVAELADLDICFGPVATLSEMMRDPQVRHRGMVSEMDDGKGRRLTALGNPVKLTATPPTLRTPPPELGQHTDAVLASLGYSAGDVAGLRDRGVV